MRTVGLSAAVLAMSLAGPAFAAMDEKKKPAGEQQGTQQQSTNKQQDAGQAATSGEAKNETKAGSGAATQSTSPSSTSQAQSGSGVEQPTESPETAGQSGTGNQSGSGDTATGEVTKGQDIGSDANEQASLTAAQGKEMIGKTLVGADDQQVGEINDVVVTDDGKLKSVLINVGGFLGIGDKTVAIPADTIQVQGDKVIAGDLTKEAAENMTEYKATGG